MIAAKGKHCCGTLVGRLFWRSTVLYPPVTMLPFLDLSSAERYVASAVLSLLVFGEVVGVR